MGNRGEEMKDILLSIRPKWCEKICHEIGKDENGKPIYEKRIEVRKTAPKEVPFKAYIYCTKRKINGEILLTYDKKIEGRNRGFKENGDISLAGKVIGKFICDKVYSIKNQGSRFSVVDEEQGVTNEIARQSCLDYDDMVGYLGNKDGYGWHISDLKIYDKPKPIMQFYKPCPIKIKNCPVCELYSTYTGCCMNNITRPPQSYMFVEEIREK